MSKFFKAAAIAALGMGTLAIASGSASASVACNAAGECWHVKRAYTYQPEYGVVVHPSNWRAGPNDKVVWREHTGRGYWRNGVWIKF